MITEYEIRVRRPWRPGMKKGDLLKVNSRLKVRLCRGGFADLVKEDLIDLRAAKLADKPAKPRNPTRKPVKKAAPKKS